MNPTLDSRDTPSRKGSEDGHGEVHCTTECLI